MAEKGITMTCPCGSNQDYKNCCSPFIEGAAFPETAEKLMRSRYTAFAKGEIAYLKKTCAPETRKDFDEAGVRDWSKNSKWLGLKILSTEKGTANDKKGKVEFMAKYEAEGKTLDHHEVSDFRKDSNGHWVFEDGESHVHEEGDDHHHHHVKPQTVVNESPKIGRNDPCTCGSGKKYKKCCGVAA